MEWEVVLKFVTATIAGVGAGGAIVFALSSWLGKVWANRILANEKHILETELEKTKRELECMDILQCLLHKRLWMRKTN